MLLLLLMTTSMVAAVDVNLGSVVGLVKSASSSTNQQSISSLSLPSSVADRQARHHHPGHAGLTSPNDMILTCPKSEYIHPCDCLELDKRLEASQDLPVEEEKVEEEGSKIEGSGAEEEINFNNSTVSPSVVSETSTVDRIIHPELIETVAFCKNIRNVQVLTEAIRGFIGHRVNYFVLDGCKLPPFPNNMFQGVGVLWMEVLNSTIQFHEAFFGCANG